MLFHIILLSRNNLFLHLFLGILKIMKNCGTRLLLLHYWKQEFKATDASKICQVEGKGTVTERTVQH